MRFSRFVSALAGLALSAMAVVALTPAAYADDDPDDVVESVYDLYKDRETPGILSDPKLASQYLTARLAQLVASHGGRVGFDPVVDGREWELSDIEVEEKGQRGDIMVVEANFVNGGETKRVGYALVFEDGAWRIDDIAAEGPQGRWVLSKILTATL